MRLLKNISISILAVIVLISSINNIKNQLETIAQAKKRTGELQEENAKLERENAVWQSRIEYATSSAYLEQQARNKLGMGGEDDYWLILPPEEAAEVKEEVKAVEPPLPTWKQWWVKFFGP
ncbi:MAG: septum formation initiator family protein [Candidatus Shapirobacteria bacterium]|jgi:cell division protein FtsB